MNRVLKMLGKKDTVEMDREELIEEHERLIKILEKGDRVEQHKEAIRQKRELMQYEDEEELEED